MNEVLEDELALGAPAAAVYKTHSTSIVDVLEDLKDKAEAELADLRKAETNAQHNYDMLKQSLEDQKATTRPPSYNMVTGTCAARGSEQRLSEKKRSQTYVTHLNGK